MTNTGIGNKNPLNSLMKTQKNPHTQALGSILERGPREKQLYGNFGRDGLVLVLELDTDCPGERVFTYLMRGGIEEGAMTPQEFEQAGPVYGQLIQKARELWPEWFRRRDVCSGGN
jgi:hypothetical protein